MRCLGIGLDLNEHSDEVVKTCRNVSSSVYKRVMREEAEILELHLVTERGEAEAGHAFPLHNGEEVAEDDLLPMTVVESQRDTH